MKKIFLGVLLLAGFAICSQAQDKGDHALRHMHKEMIHNHMRMAMQKMNLTEAQKQQMKQIHQDYRTRITGLEKNDNLLLKDYKTQKQQLRLEEKAKIQGLLTADQKSQLEKFKKEGREKHDMMSAKHMERMKSTLGLSADQVAKIKDQQATMHTKAASIRENTSLTPEQKKQQLKSLKEEMKTSFQSDLTPAQLQTLREKKEEHKKDK